MAAVSINTGGVCHEDKLSDTPREQWPALLRERRMYIETQFEYDCRCIVQYLAEAEEFHEELGYESADDMIQQELLIRPEWVRIAVDWLTQQDRPDPVPQSELNAAIEIAKAQPLAAHGEIGNGRADESRVDLIKSTQGGTSQSYLLRRIARDQPELLDQIGPGKSHRSARAAAIEAGIIKPVPTVRLVEDVSAVAKKLRQHLTQQQITSLVEALLQ
jgi:hypothetical protein